jgi:phospholipase C
MPNLKMIFMIPLALCVFVLCSSVAYGSSVLVTVVTNGPGSGAVVSSPVGINCPQICSAAFSSGTAITLTETSLTGSTFANWSGACSGTSPSCNISPTANTTVTARFNGTGLSSLKHIIFMAQENRSLDNYFGAMRAYWFYHHYPDQSFDGLPQFNPSSGAPPLRGPAPALPGCNPNDPPPSDCIWDTANLVKSFHFKTVCNENTSPSWNEAHVDWNFYDQVGRYPPAKNNGFVKTAGHDARTNYPSPFYDVNGLRAMGYWQGSDLNYYYFMASKFGTSDRWFHPLMARTNPNREYLLAATSHGYAYPNGSDANDTALLNVPTIFQRLQSAGISWKIYVNPQGTKCSGPPYAASCLIQHSYIHNFTFYKTILSSYPNKIAPISQYFTDLNNGTLPSVALIEPASNAGLDEHGSDTDKVGTNVQKGAKYVSSLINALMKSSSWKSSAFILTYDESGGMYDHVSPQKTVSPDGIKPVDLHPGDVCTKITGPTCDFVYTGYRVPLIVVSPYAKKNYVSHTVADYTAILKFIETRFHLAALTKRDAGQMDMTEFFSFATPSWMTPPTPPAQNTANSCYLTHVP